MTYGEKYDKDGYSIFRFYRDVNRGHDVDARIGGLYPNVLDHVILKRGVSDILISCTAESMFVDDAIAALQRFVSRCLAEGKGMPMVWTFSRVLAHCFPFNKAAIELFLSCGAKLDPNDPSYFTRSCQIGAADTIKQMLPHKDVMAHNVIDAAESGNCEAITLVASAYRGSYEESDRMKLHNATVQSLELLLSLNVIQRGKHYMFKNIPSFSVLQWILDHDVMKHDRMLIDIASNASCYSGHYFDMLRYLIEQRKFTVPRGILMSINACRNVELDVFDYLSFHGADVNAVKFDDEDEFDFGGIVDSSPMLVRYWIDKGAAITFDCMCMITAIGQNMTAPVLEMMIDKYSMNVNATSPFGSTMLHYACSSDNYEIVEMLIQHGADVNKPDRDGVAAYDQTKDDRIKQILIQHGYVQQRSCRRH